MADDFFSDIQDDKPDDKPSGGFFSDIADDPDQEQPRGVAERARVGWEGGYQPATANAVEKIAPDWSKQHPIIAGAAQKAIDYSGIGAVDRALSALSGVAGAGAGAIAGIAEGTTPLYSGPVAGPLEGRALSRSEADRLQRDVTILGQAAFIEPGIGLAGQAAHVKPYSNIAREARAYEPPPAVGSPEAEAFRQREQATRPPPPPPKPPPAAEPPLREGQRGPAWREAMDEHARWREAFDAGQTTAEMWEPPRNTGARFGEIRPENGMWNVYENGVIENAFGSRQDAANFLRTKGYGEPRPPPQAEAGPQPGAGPRQEPPFTQAEAKAFEDILRDPFSMYQNIGRMDPATWAKFQEYLKQTGRQAPPGAGPRGPEPGPKPGATGPQPEPEPGPQPKPGAGPRAEVPPEEAAPYREAAAGPFRPPVPRAAPPPRAAAPPEPPPRAAPAIEVPPALTPEQRQSVVDMSKQQLGRLDATLNDPETVARLDPATVDHYRGQAESLRGYIEKWDRPPAEAPARITEPVPAPSPLVEPAPEPVSPRAAEPPSPPVAEARPAGFFDDIPEDVPPAAAPEPTFGQAPKPGRQQSLLQFIAQNGGISSKDPMVADVRAIIGRKNAIVPGYGALIRPNGKPLDRLLEAAVEGRYIEDRGFWQPDTPRTSTIRDLLDAMSEERGGTKRYPIGEEAGAAPQRPISEQAILRKVGEIENEWRQLGLTREDLNLEALYDAAKAAMHDPSTGLLDLYEQAVVARAESDAQSAGAGRFGAEAYPAGREAAGPRAAETPAAAGARDAGVGAAAEPPQQEAGIPKRQAMSRVPPEPTVEPGVEGKPQLVIPGAERLTPAEILQRKVQAPLKPKAQQKPPGGMFDRQAIKEAETQQDLFTEPPPKKPEPDQGQLLVQRKPIERGRSGRPIRTERIPIGTEQEILERGYEKATGERPPPGEIPPEKQAMARERFDKRVARSLKETFDPGRISEAALQAEPLFAERNSRIAQAQDQFYREGGRRYKAWNRIPEDRQLKFMDDLETASQVEPKFAGPGAAHVRPSRFKPLRGVAETYRKLLDEAYLLESLWGSKAAYHSEYFPHIWDRPDQFKKFMDNAHGATWFQKNRTFDLIKDGLAAGFKLKTTNPEALMRMRLMAGADMRNTMRLLQDLFNQRQAVQARGLNPNVAASLARQNWREFSAPDRTNWLISPDVQPLWDNAVKAKGLWAKEGFGGDAFRAWMGFKNVWVPIRLSMSAFHLLHVAHINWAHHTTSALNQAARGRLIGATASLGRSLSPYQGRGRKGRTAWLQEPSMRTPEGQNAVRLMNEGGFSPMLSEQLRIDASEKISDAIRAWNPFKVAYHGLLRRPIQAVQSGLFEHWIPHLKTAAYLNDAAALLRRHPEYMNDPVNRKVALRAIAKSVDNRFGEMFYSNLFWNRTLKDTGIASFLSLGWNLGFVREFIGAALEVPARIKGTVMKPSATRQVIRDATNKISFVSVYLAAGAAISAMITKAFIGEGDDPEITTPDLFFPRSGGVNPDGSPRRMTTMFYNREIPMLRKHIEEHGGGVGGAFWGLGGMVYNKLLVQPLVELYKNQNYYGSEIFDPEAPATKQIQQVLAHLYGQQFSPMAASGAQRVRETGGTKTEEAMSYLGFGPAPSYASKSAIQNYIAHQYQKYISPEKRPFEEEVTTHAKQVARNKLLMAKQRGDKGEIAEAIKEAQVAGLTPTYIREVGTITTSQRMFRRLSQQHPQIGVGLLNRMTPEERKQYWGYTSPKAKTQWRAEHPGEMTGFAEGGSVTDRERGLEELRFWGGQPNAAQDLRNQQGYQSEKIMHDLRGQQFRNPQSSVPFNAPTAYAPPPDPDWLQQIHGGRQEKVWQREQAGGTVFDPEGSGYDKQSAMEAGLGPDATGHWPSRIPATGLILKGRGHETYPLTEKGEAEAGYVIQQGPGGRYYSQQPARRAIGGLVSLK